MKLSQRVPSCVNVTNGVDIIKVYICIRQYPLEWPVFWDFCCYKMLVGCSDAF
jgi:hypothetical protein